MEWNLWSRTKRIRDHHGVSKCVRLTPAGELILRPGYVGSQLGKATVTWAKEQQRHVQKHAATEEKRRLVAQAKKNLVIPNADKIEAVSSQQRSATTTATAVVV